MMSLFNKKNLPAVPATQNQAQTFDVDQMKITTLIATGAKLKGDLLLDESTYIKGEIHGNVEVTTPKMMINVAAGARIVGNLSADIVVLAGELTGNITARIVRIRSTAVIDGDVYHDKVLVEEGARIRSCHLIKKDATEFNAETTSPSANVMPISSSNRNY